MSENARSSFERVVKKAFAETWQESTDQDLAVNEIEFTLRNFYRKNRPEQGVILFDQMSRTLKNLFSEPEINYQLVISQEGSNERVIISNLSAIQHYCQTNNLLKEETKVQTKTVIKTNAESALEKEYDVRLRMAHEDDQNLETSPGYRWAQDDVSEKTYRFRKRYTYQIKPGFQFDLSVVKQGMGTTFDQANTRDKEKDVRILDSKESYDIEIEWSSEKPITQEELDQVFDTLVDNLYMSLQIKNNSPIVISKREQKRVLEEFFKLTGRKDKFVGPSVYPLGLQHLLDPKKYPEFAPTQIVLKNYAYSYKADGVRHLMFFDQTGQVYLIDMNLGVKKTDYQFEDSVNSLLDVEVVDLKPIDQKMSPSRYKIWIFDALFDEGNDIRSKPLFPKGRYDQVVDVNEMLNGKVFATSPFYTSAAKPYYRENVAELERLIAIKDKLDFAHDGLVLTDWTRAYPTQLDFNQQYGFAFKVKNLNQLTIDFLVKPSKGPSRVEMINQQLVTFQKLDLYVNRGFISLFHPVYNDIVTGSNYAYPPVTKKIEEGQLTSSMRTLEDKFPIYPNFVYECSYQLKQMADPVSGWKLIRHRPIKTVKHSPNAWFTANSTWDMILNILQNPEKIGEITEDNLLFLIQGFLTSEKSKTVQEFIQKTVPKPKFYYNSSLGSYYDQLKANQPLIQSMNNMHNQIKSLLYQKTCDQIRKNKRQKKIRLLELASGTGGDYQKWVFSGITDIIGLEIDYQQINEAIARYRAALKRYNSLSKSKKSKGLIRPPNVKYIWADMLKPLDKAGRNEEAQDQIDKLILNRPEQFDLTSCQFAMHFAMRNERTFRTFLRNVATNLKSGGYFIGTSFIAHRSEDETKDPEIGPGVFQALEANEGKMVYQESVSKEKGKGKAKKKEADLPKEVTIWSIMRKYTEKQLLDFGQIIQVYLISLHGGDKPVDEYLVNLTSAKIKSIAREFNLQLVQVAQLGNPNNPQAFGEIYKKIRNGEIDPITMGKIDVNKELEDLYSKDRLIEFSRYNSVFIFQKK